MLPQRVSKKESVSRAISIAESSWFRHYHPKEASRHDGGVILSLACVESAKLQCGVVKMKEQDCAAACGFLYLAYSFFYLLDKLLQLTHRGSKQRV